MKLEGSYDVAAPGAKVREAFLDPKQLRKAIPGCEKLEALGPDEFKATLKIGVAAVKGTFEGKVRLADKKPPESYRLVAEGSGGPGFVKADTPITLTQIDRGTRLSSNAGVPTGGPIARRGPPMPRGRAEMMARPFFHPPGGLVP